ncbi:MAG: galactose ABC transporter substrate-binding protein [Candidatus Izemoplasmatales bacterium]|nr:galactose ABC transporter substrate-binding protein [bacterium]MDZ4197249.1 galactose ABC transporter substrate-binding protein [Candidatus Izemoplasmatales bacterium]
MKKIISGLFLLVITVLFGCTSPTQKVYLFIYDMDDPYIAALANEIVRVGKDYYPIEIHDAQNSQILQNERIEEVLKIKPRLIIINPVDRLGAYPIIEKAKAVGVPIIFINREPLARDLDLYDQSYYVGALAEQSGILQAELVAELFGNNPVSLNEFDRNNDNIIQMIIMKGEQGHQDAELRTEFIVSELERRGFALEVLTTEIANWNTLIAKNRAMVILPSLQDRVEVIVSNNDAMAIGVIQAMIDLGIFTDENENQMVDKDDDFWIPVIGIDGIEEATNYMRSGHLYATVLNDAIGQAYATISLARFLLDGIALETVGLELTNQRYVWVDYKKYTLTED